MKKHVLIGALGLGLCAGPLALSAKSLDELYIETYQNRPGSPVPVSIVRPSVGPEFVGTELNLEFIVDELGIPRRFVSPSQAPRELVRVLIDSVQRWKFKPRVGKNGTPRSTRVRLPVRIIEKQTR